MLANVLEENSRQMDQHRKRLVFRTLIGNSEKSTRCRAEVTAHLDRERDRQTQTDRHGERDKESDRQTKRY